MLTVRSLRKKRNGVSIITAALGVIIVIIIIAVGLFMVLGAGGLANIGIGGNGSANNTPIGITLTTTNSTLAPALVTAGGPMLVSYLQAHALILQPNVLYTFSVTVTAVNPNLKPINTSIPVMLDFAHSEFTNGVANLYGLNANISPSSGTLPYNAILSIIIPPNSNGTIYISAFNITGVNNGFAGCEIFIRSAY
ncbi:MAG: hypothetical protein JRN66_08875 [Nitrososphaerota archaeon]|jgi:hypothetical protein|nr:hypothetical protein [Nitrososphaerota archaeon]